MKRRAFVQGLPLAALPLLPVCGSGTEASAQTGATQRGKVAARAPSAKGAGEVPDYAGKIFHSDMDGIGPDGKPTGQQRVKLWCRRHACTFSC